MLKLLKFEFKRLWKTKALVLLWILCVAIAVMGAVLNNFFYDGIDDSYRKLLSIFNAYTQFSYLILGFLFVTVFTRDNTNGIVNFYKQIGFSQLSQYTCKTIMLFLASVPLIAATVIICGIIYQNQDPGFLLTMLIAIIFSMLFIILLALFVSLILKNTLRSVLVFYGLFVLFNILNLAFYGLTNPADGNSIVTFCMSNWNGISASHYSLDKIAKDIIVYKKLICCFVPAGWCLLLLLVNMVLIKIKGRDS